MSKVINVAYAGGMEITTEDYTSHLNAINTSDIQWLENELQAVERQMISPRKYKGGWKQRKVGKWYAKVN